MCQACWEERGRGGSDAGCPGEEAGFHGMEMACP